MTDVELINNKELTNDDVVAYALLCDRMKSSRTNRQFFDAKLDDYYVIYTLAELAEKLKVSIRKTGAILRKLVKLGYIIKKKQFSRADKLFLPKFERPEAQNVQHVDAESAGPKVQNLPPNHSHLNQSDKSKIYTSDTEDARETPIEKWRNAVIGSTKLPGLAIDAILKYTDGDLKQAYKLVGLIHKAKHFVVNNNGIKNKSFTKYERNENIQVNLGARLMHVFSYARNKRNELAYIMSCLKTFFLEAFGLVKDELEKPEAESKQPHKDLRPQWMKDREKYGHDIVEEVDPEEKKRIITKIEKLRAEVRQDQAEYQRRNC
ncbi:hypothetical protein [Nicoliella lavandulae]|uniref:Helix-turn-helix domain-containing protein n=1 Tax=Nicoliella lavandulae TaxID=3082954 RepID=A0ABU8SMT3_9LACO